MKKNEPAFPISEGEYFKLAAIKHEGMTDREYHYYCMGLHCGFCEGRKAGAELAAEMYTLRNVAIQIKLPDDLMLAAREDNEKNI